MSDDTEHSNESEEQHHDLNINSNPNQNRSEYHSNEGHPETDERSKPNGVSKSSMREEWNALVFVR
nr:hypothetical protein [Halorubrum vacuolatum]